ncbi:hypothetical protein B0T24DRAFT_347793 [Lasiosphaeria ovina]|uniref:Uncharacterized protein n=1 Tax=Lasiosphaeria ovina TaxID=92902 RepID=A0AAE0K3L3_9PEZI|nr:hypothetical protein B0T24DRAFT_347793 [Lasiosphaeria ovina]
MHFSTTLFNVLVGVSTLATSVGAFDRFHLPTRTVDGDNEVDRLAARDIEGVIDGFDRTNDRTFSGTTGRVFCGCGFNVDPGNLKKAVDQIKALSKQTIEEHTQRIEIADNVAAFACGGRGPAKADVEFDPVQMSQAEELIVKKCGKNIAGSILFGELLLGYLRFSFAERIDVCGAGQSSLQQHC